MTDRSESLTGVRALAAGWVLLFHLQLFGAALFRAGSWCSLIAEQGYLGVDFFFVLSGFIIAHQYMDRLSRPSGTSVARFVLLRLARIYPLHILTMALMAVLVLGGARLGMKSSNPDQLSPRLGIANLLLVHSWGWTDQRSWNEPSWSISCEWFAYLCFPWLAVGLGRVKRAGLAWLVCLGPLVAMWALLRALGADSVGETLRYGLIRISGEFSSGCGAYLVWRRAGALPGPSWSAAALLAVLAVVVGFRIADPLAVAIFPLLILALIAHPTTPLARVLASPAMVLVGELSYGIYMLNQRVILVINRAFPFARMEGHGLAARAGMGLLVSAVIVLCSLATYRWFEEPIRLGMRRWIDRRFPGAVRSSAVLAPAAADAQAP